MGLDPVMAWVVAAAPFGLIGAFLLGSWWGWSRAHHEVENRFRVTEEDMP